MAAKDYQLAVTALTNTIWICKPSKQHKGVMTDDRVKVDKSHFIGIVLEWVLGELEDDKESLEITVDDKVVAEFKIYRDRLLP
jgi:hypothetical protein